MNRHAQRDELHDSFADPIPDPEPPVPSLLEPDPAVFHHDIPQTPSPEESE